MRENAFDSSTRRGEMSYSAFHYFTLSVFTFFPGPHVGRPTVGTKSFDNASNSILSDGPTGYMTNRSPCFIMSQNSIAARWQPEEKFIYRQRW